MRAVTQGWARCRAHRAIQWQAATHVLFMEGLLRASRLPGTGIHSPNVCSCGGRKKTVN